MSDIYFNENKNKPFEPFVIMDNKDNLPKQKRETKSVLQTLNNLENDTYERLRRKKRQTNSLIAIGGSATLAAVVFIAVITGKSQKLSKKMQHLFGGVESKFADVKDRHLHKLLTTSFGVFDRFGKVITNSSPIKDWAIYKALDKTKATRNIRDYVSDIYTKENRNSVTKSLEKSQESYTDFIKTVENAINQSEKNPSLINNKEEFNKLKQEYNNAKNTPTFLATKTFEENYSIMQNDMDFLSKEITFKKLFSKEALQGFVPQSILVERRAKYVKKLIDEKNVISCSFVDMRDYARSKLDDTNIFIYSIKDPAIQKKLRDCSLNLDDSLKKYVKNSSDKESRDAHAETVRANIQKFKEEVSLLPSTDIKDKLSVHMDEYENLFKEYKKGIVQEIRTAAGDAWGNGSNFDKAIKEKATIHSKDLNLALTRTINMFDKQRDIALGSGPADVIGLLTPIVICGWSLNKKETKEEKIGVALEAGIPIVGGVLVYLRTLALQYNGVKALATSAGVGILLNLAGSMVYKKYMSNQELAKKKEKESTPQQL